MSKRNNEEKGKSLFSKIFRKKEKTMEEPVLFLRNTGKAEVKWIVPKNNQYIIEDKTYHFRPGSSWELKEGMKKKNMKVIPEWGMYPLGPSDYLQALKTDEANVQFDMIRAIQTAETVRSQMESGKQKINPKIAILVLIGLVVAAYFLMGGA